MAAIELFDDLPPEWRALGHEFSIESTILVCMYHTGDSLEDVRDVLVKEERYKHRKAFNGLQHT